MQPTQSATQTDANPADLLALYADEIYRFCRSLTYCTADAEDLFQDTFLSALVQHQKGKRHPDLRKHLYATAVFVWKSAKRKYARRERVAPSHPLTDGVAAHGSFEADVEKRETAQFVRELVAALPDKYRIPVTLFYANGLSLADISDTLQIPAGTVKSRLFKARGLLEKGLANRV